MSIDQITLWHERARPNPTPKQLNTQIGCHFEEVVEMLEALKPIHLSDWEDVDSVIVTLTELANRLKSNDLPVDILSRENLLDSLCDTIVTAVGVAHCANMDIVEGLHRVNKSNWSKYDTEGQPIFDKNGKITKGPNYEPPDLKGLF